MVAASPGSPPKPKSIYYAGQMVTTAQADMVWNNDGHTLWLRLERENLQIVEISCPGTDACQSRNGCVVQWFVRLYGFDCNIGACAPEEKLEICWALVGDPNYLEEAQLWFVPVKDEVFHAWMTSRLQT